MATLRMIAATALGVTMTLAPVSGLAKDPHGKGDGHGHRRAEARMHLQPVEVSRNHRVIAQATHAAVGHCPPGLAQKDPACVPPGQARKGGGNGVVVGDILDLSRVHIINQPGLYGLGEPPAGNRYAVLDGRLVRIDAETGRLLSIIRLVDAILD